MIIIATASQLANNLSILKKIILSGPDVLRFNFSYGNIDEKIIHIQTAQDIINETGGQTKILADLPSPKIRLGGFPLKEFYVEEGQTLTLKSAPYSDDPKNFIPVQCPEIGNLFCPEQTIIIDEGEISLKVNCIMDKDTIEVLLFNTGYILPYKGLNWTEQIFDHNEHIEKIATAILPILTHLNLKYLTCPFVNNADIAKKYREAIAKQTWANNQPKIVLKLETEEAIKNAEAIIPLGDTILLERGDLGIRSSFEKMGVCQKHIISLCKKMKKPLFISSQILESTIHNFVPQRSEICDLTSMVLDGVKGIVLCHETGINGVRPAYPISVAKKIIEEAKAYKSKISKE
ncbi:MAG: hypothetical protein HY979_03550 [Candidatus Magasanikbacteria bacterium]|nr:hypothetical protein [Candidatus Magasanikbacteria bacterium]